MTRSTKWMSLLGMGLVWAYSVSPAQADQPRLAPHPQQPQPARAIVATAQLPEYQVEGQDEDADGSDTDSQDSDEAMDDTRIDPATDGNEQGEYSPDDGADDESTTEVIKERYPDGSIKIEREVTQDAQGNYINHGTWKMFAANGAPMAQGEYRYGNRTGTWVRWYRGASEAELLTKVPYRNFPGPFISQATFEHGQLDGVWIIYDGKKHKVSQFEYADGHRNGKSTWWHPNGKKAREVQYRDGQVDGQLIEWGPEGSVLIKETYQDGRKIAEKQSNYPGGAKKSKGVYLFAREVEQSPDDWWNAKLMTTTKAGKDEKHGPWVSWHSNGQKQLEGSYDHNLQVGQFTWWHPNGQKALEGRFENGKQDGHWTWWYPSGQKSIHGEYAHGNPTGRWTWWKEDGRVAQSADLSHSEGVVIDTPKPTEPARMPQVRKPTPAKSPVR